MWGSKPVLVMQPAASVLLLLLLTPTLHSLTTASLHQEGSGDEAFDLIHHSLADLEDIDEEEEGSGEWDLLNPVTDDTSSSSSSSRVPRPSLSSVEGSGKQVGDDEARFEYDIHFSKMDFDGKKVEDTSEDEYEYYDELYPEEYKELMKNYDEEEEEEYNYVEEGLGEDSHRNSVLKIEDDTTRLVDIEIKPKPTSETTDELILETSQIFIMVGSAFVSFAIVMLTFFMCRRSMNQKRAKQQQLGAGGIVPFTFVADTRLVKESSIVKDYHKVPTSTQEFLQTAAGSRHIDMYRGQEDQPSGQALLN